ncbi:hypothetical protein DYB30_008402 [Aphanomyces astaci]|uniref:RWD domain-containing protein n=2 Tax=Aphanomyces astaci TaxID=112090 RepID=A0A397D431_APHAT|nr:hypothetical protein DYB36_004073 [Aphanomyces astaci]RHY58405.1 hypothetical protein DYB38_011917 [Aphanomyces astaci]RHY73340.1 hypothetical protein DYB30_008402 [Aphanomyces astaci]RHY89209.1 hypothetical protein DYB31_005597 [Aphanomyces astaci]
MADEAMPLYAMAVVHIQQQVDELECLASMFPSDDEMHVDPYVKVLFESAAMSATEASATFDLPLIHTCPVDNHIAELKLSFPKDYPTEPLDVELVCPTLPRAIRTSIADALEEIATSCAGDVSTLQIYQEAVARIDQASHSFGDAALDLPTICRPPPRPAINTSEIGRRAIYFHHIIAPGKRQVVKDWAKELHLGGFSKIGWPGVIVVEGVEAFVSEYVKRLQHLRWKQMVVRGEQVDTERKLPSGLVELTDMSDLATRCAAAGLTALFLTSMKIYR